MTSREQGLSGPSKHRRCLICSMVHSRLGPICGNQHCRAAYVRGERFGKRRSVGGREKQERQGNWGRKCQECHARFAPRKANQKTCSPDCSARRNKRLLRDNRASGEWSYGNGKGAKAKAQRWKPTMTFGICPRCGKERTCIHRCPLTPEQTAAVHRELFPIKVPYGFRVENA